MRDQHPRHVYFQLAKEIAKESKDPKIQVGCIIVTSEGILYPGYNGDERGGSNERESLLSGHSGFIHAEENALIKFNPTVHRGSVMYCTHSPCRMCAKRIINSMAITAVYCGIIYEPDGITLLLERGVNVVVLERT